MQKKYNFVEIEKITQCYWNKINAYQTTENDTRFPNGKFYTCSMLPYPSGKLHMGHVRNYTINDVMYRYMRMNGYNVLMPMGWDAFGMPAENAAILNNTSPAKWTYDNVSYMKKQLSSLGLAIDWSREIITCSPKYYKWNQWIFLKMFKRGIIYKKTGIVNWDPIEKTVLANEQVINGRGWRSDAIIEKKKIPMYYAKITNYAEELLEYVKKKLPYWPKKVRLMQVNWIGKSKGIFLAFPHNIKDPNKNNKLIQNGKLWIFTTRIDIIYGITFCVISPEHPLAIFAARNNLLLQKFILEYKKNNNIESNNLLKKSILTQLKVLHPLTNQEIKVFVVNYVIEKSYGRAAIGVPAHNKHDFYFAKKHSLLIKQVINVKNKSYSDKIWKDWYIDKENCYCINSCKYNNMSHKEATNAISTDLIKLGLGNKKNIFRLRDWAISRQRYWGTPIPIIYCDSCGSVPVPEKDLPVILPETCVPNNLLKENKKFLHVSCPKCNKLAFRETDTMDTFVDSSWYYMRYISPKLENFMIDDNKINYWMPVDQYIGGIEHAILHLLYARFWTKLMYNLGLIKFNEPFIRLLTQGMILNKTYYRIENSSNKKRWYNPDDVKITLDKKNKPIHAILKLDKKPVIIGGIEKMSKSKNNGIDPQTQINTYGADSTRLFIIFSAPPEKNLEWSDIGIEGAYRFLNRVWNFSYILAPRIINIINLNIFHNDFSVIKFNNNQKVFRRKIHKILQQINRDIKRIQYNTVVSGCMKIFNILERINSETKFDNNKNTNNDILLYEGMSIFLRVLNPIAPHITHILWKELKYSIQQGDILNACWPKIDSLALEEEKEEVKLIIQINGKFRGHIFVKKKCTTDFIKKIVLKNKVIQKYIIHPPKKFFIIPNKLVNIII
ncbi:leucine--tRNA ligase [Candidatus Profftella armatura]|uniref:leucine--tRNA ligase n=2 Tax=cellular organisms TaxID=131567 RepID=A0A3Q0J659_DIACI|nr:leucine--tRNA ligase [Candidatus Profftella armatura]XP_026683962.1 uncharacterized protein LOC108253173 [Diaphorina citri]AGS06918.1 leucyl-tRNA synthetase [Candidatus Profftella armatura]ALC95998.1 leucine--tRNA ligase [Candidatus Profftella armatura]QLK13826.1 leucine--tRNA ligase [Candidatus Profftella armatura]